MKKNILIFDFDGTIADTFQYILNLSDKLAEEFKFNKIHPDEVEQLKNNTLSQTIKHLKIPMLKIPLILSYARKELHKDITKIKPIKGLDSTLAQIKMQGIKMGILSSNSAKNIKEFLKYHDIEFFDFIHTSSKLWGKHRCLKRIIKKNALTNQNIFYVGDETRDIEAAKKIGIQSIAVGWGYNSVKALKISQPNHLIQNPKQLLKICI